MTTQKLSEKSIGLQVTNIEEEASLKGKQFAAKVRAAGDALNAKHQIGRAHV